MRMCKLKTHCSSRFTESQLQKSFTEKINLKKKVIYEIRIPLPLYKSLLSREKRHSVQRKPRFKFHTMSSSICKRKNSIKRRSALCTEDFATWRRQNYGYLRNRHLHKIIRVSKFSSNQELTYNTYNCSEIAKIAERLNFYKMVKVMQ